MNKLENLVNKQLQFIKEIEDKFLKAVEKYEPALLKAVLDVLDDFNTESGRFLSDDTNTRILLEVERRIKDVVNRDELRKLVDDVLIPAYDKIFNSSKEIHKEASDFNLDTIERDLSPFKKKSQSNLLQFTTAGVFAVFFIAPIIDVIFEGVSLKTTVKELKNKLKVLITGGADRLGIFRRRSQQVTQDSLNQFAGTIAKVAEQKQKSKFTHMMYVGSLIEDSRVQCQRWIDDFNGLIPLDKLDSEIIWAYNNGSGMIPGTTKENFEINTGGHNCRHYALKTIVK